MDWLSNKPVKACLLNKRWSYKGAGKPLQLTKRFSLLKLCTTNSPVACLQEGEQGSQASQLLLLRNQRYQCTEYLLRKATKKVSQLDFFFY